MWRLLYHKRIGFVPTGFVVLLLMAAALWTFFGRSSPPAPPPPPEISLERIFAEDHSWVSKLPDEHLRTVMATGDVIPARSVNAGASSRNDFTWPYQKTAALLAAADVTLINLETPFISSCPTVIDGMKFCGDQRNIEGLQFAGVDVAGIGNNHAGNYGIEGIRQTITLLRNNGIAVTGSDDQPVVKDIRGIRFGFLAYNDIGYQEEGIAWAENTRVAADIKKARKVADVVIVSFHWGIEYVTQPSDRQKELGHLAADSGADVVIGNHPHWVEPVELYKGKLIMYAHGNFVFDQMWSPETMTGVVGKYTFYDTRLIDVQYFPIRIVDYGQPNFLEGAEKQKVLDDLKAASEQLIQK